jgi:hypothetical protein
MLREHDERLGLEGEDLRRKRRPQRRAELFNASQRHSSLPETREQATGALVRGELVEERADAVEDRGQRGVRELDLPR